MMPSFDFNGKKLMSAGVDASQHPQQNLAGPLNEDVEMISTEYQGEDIGPVKIMKLLLSG